jgi:phage terminase small subunit
MRVNIMPRGRKPTKNETIAMSQTPPRGLPVEVRKCWIRLCNRIHQSSGTGIAAADAEVLIMAAHQLARVEAMRLAAASEPFTTPDERGVQRMHPLWGELRNAESQLRSTFTVLMLTPRSRKTQSSNIDPAGPNEDDINDIALRILG